MSLAIVLRTRTKPVTGLYISRDEPLAGRPRYFLSEADLNSILLGMRNGSKPFQGEFCL